jgi:hypothetical protein
LLQNRVGGHKIYSVFGKMVHFRFKKKKSSECVGMTQQGQSVSEDHLNSWVFLVVLGLELKVSCLLIRHSITLTTLPPSFILGICKIEFCKLFASSPDPPTLCLPSS